MPNQFARSLGKRIRARRQDPERPSSGPNDPGGALTQEQLATLLTVSQPAVSGWEKGIAIPALPALVKLADVLDTTVDALVGDEPDAGVPAKVAVS